MNSSNLKLIRRQEQKKVEDAMLLSNALIFSGYLNQNIINQNNSIKGLNNYKAIFSYMFFQKQNNPNIERYFYIHPSGYQASNFDSKLRNRSIAFHLSLDDFECYMIIQIFRQINNKQFNVFDPEYIKSFIETFNSNIDNDTKVSTAVKYKKYMEDLKIIFNNNCEISNIDDEVTFGFSYFSSDKVISTPTKPGKSVKIYSFNDIYNYVNKDIFLLLN